MGLPVSYDLASVRISHMGYKDGSSIGKTISFMISIVFWQNAGVHYETWNTGVLGPVTLKGVNSGTWDMSKWKWSYKVLLNMVLIKTLLRTTNNTKLNVFFLFVMSRLVLEVKL